MVFSTFPNERRRRRGKTLSLPIDRGTSSASLDGIADELLLHVLAHLPTGDVLKLRQSCKAVGPACFTVLLERLKTLYLHPSHSSMRRIPDICASDLSLNIEELALVGKVPLAGTQEYFRPACHWFPERLSRSGQQSDPSLVGATGTSDDAAWKRLTDSLANLPQLRRITFVEACADPGLNMVSQGVIDGHAHKVAKLPQSNASGGGECDFGLLLGLAMHTGLHFQGMTVAQDLPLPRASPWHRPRAAFLQKVYKNIGSTFGCTALTTLRLDLHSLPHKQPTKWTWFCRVIVKRAASTLQSLKLAVRDHPVPMTRFLASFLCDTGTSDKFIIFRALRNLELAAVYPAINTEAAGRRNYRPLLQEFELLKFLNAHSTTLTTITIDNIIFDSAFKQDANTLHKTLHAMQSRHSAQQSVKQTPLQFEGLARFQWIVSDHVQDVQCRRSACGAAQGCKYFCGYIYGWYGSRVAMKVTDEHLRLLAAEFGACWDEGQRAWVFESDPREGKTMGVDSGLQCIGFL